MRCKRRVCGCFADPPLCDHQYVSGARSRRHWSLARELLLLELIVVVLIATLGAVVTVRIAQQKTVAQERQRVLDVAQSLASSPGMADALQLRDPSRTLEPLAERLQREMHLSWIVVMSPQGVRYTHPNPTLIGKHFKGHIAPAVHGRAFTEEYSGTLGPSVRAVAPVRHGGRVVGLVAVGILEQAISKQIGTQLPKLLGLGGVALAVGVALTLLVVRRVKRQTLGLEPREITKLYEHDQAVLHAIREGVLVLDRDARVLMANDEALRLLGLSGDVEGNHIDDLVSDGPLRARLAKGEPVRDELQVVGSRVLVVNRGETRVDGRLVGTVTTLRDRTELQELTRDLATVRGMADSLRAQAHESANVLHTIVCLVELGRYEEAVAFATEQVEVAQELLDRLQQTVREPALVALLVGKTARARERGVTLEVSQATQLTPTGAPAGDLVTIVGNLIDNAIDAAAGSPDARVTVSMRSAHDEAVIEVRDNGPGIPHDKQGQVFEAGWTTKGGADSAQRGLGLALVRQATVRLGGSVIVGNDDGAVFTVRLPARSREPAVGGSVR
jgi:sensor histidine kinase regulating citrate/malate metabolism